jgi:hypothetical protein
MVCKSSNFDQDPGFTVDTMVLGIFARKQYSKAVTQPIFLVLQ